MPYAHSPHTARAAYGYAGEEHHEGIDINAEYIGLIMINIKMKFNGQLAEFHVLCRATDKVTIRIHSSALEYTSILFDTVLTLIFILETSNLPNAYRK